MKNKLLVSACLMGFQVRYNGSEKAQLAATLSRWQQAGRRTLSAGRLAGAQRRPGSGLSGSVTHRRQPYLRQPVCL